jgi:2-oxoisovalerate dehydrogenase E2 component (dihydrolipoyl transacylase)
MPTPITMPQLAETTTEGTIGQWQKQVGDHVQRYEPLVEIMTDKVNVEMTSPVSGVLTEIIAPEGATIPVGELIARITEEAEEHVGQAAPPPPPRSGEGAQPTSGGGSGQGAQPTSIPEPVHTGSAGVPPAGLNGGAGNGRVRAGHQRLTPVVARLAQQHHIDVSVLTGSGIDGRVTKQDILRYIENPNGPAAPSPSMGEGQREGEGVGRAATQPVQTNDADEIPVTPIRKAIADNMVRSKTTAPHAWSMVEVDVTNLVRWRESIKAEFARREGVDLTYLPFFVKVVAETLREHRSLNAAWAEDRILLKRHINIGLAVNRDDGLIVPVIKDADRLSITGLAHAISDTVSRARSNNLKPDDVSDGTFTVNNTGALGVTLSYPIIVPGQAAIVTTEAIVKRPVVVGDAIAIRSMMNMALAFDHRITDGGVVGSFLRTVKSRLEALGPEGALS